MNRLFEEAAGKGDLESLASLYTKDAVALPPDGPFVRSRDNIKEMWASIAQQIGLKSVKLETVALEVAGEMAHEVGEAQLTLASGTAVVKYVVVWKKADGQRRLHRDIWNTKAT